MAQRQRAGLITQRTQDRNLLSVSSHHKDNNLVITIKNRHGAEAARRAHNPEVTGSKPVAGILVMMRITT
jgi:hypothetical protein